MKVWIDGSAFENNRQHGVWRVFYEIMSRTAKDVDYTLWLRDNPQRPIPAGVQVYHDVGRKELTRFNVPMRWQRRKSLRSDPLGLREADLFHSTGFTFPINDETKSIVTVYDMIAESHFPICIREVQEGIEIKRQTLERACVLPCISQSTANELGLFYPHLSCKTIVVLLGSEHLVDLDVSRTNSKTTSAKSVLYVGQRLGYKNFLTLLNAMNLATWPRDILLHVVGSKFTDAEKLLIAKLRLTDRIHHLGTVSNSQLLETYRSAHCLVFPSFQEGFGLPLLEAQANDCPVVCSDIPVFHEVAGDAALFFDPSLGEQLAESVARVTDPIIRRRLIEQGRENIKRFSWQTSGEQMLQVYQQAISGKI